MAIRSAEGEIIEQGGNKLAVQASYIGPAEMREYLDLLAILRSVGGEDFQSYKYICDAISG